MKKQNTFIVATAVTAAVIAAFWLLLAAPGYSGNEINLPRGVTSQSMLSYQLHMIILWICVVIGVIVFSAMFISIALHRKSKGYEAARFTHSAKAEIVWTIIPVLILVAMAVPATKALVNMEVAPETEMTIKITGFQWRWKYEYVEDEIQFISSLDADSNAARRLSSGTDPLTIENYLLEVDKPLVLPANTKIKLIIYNRDATPEEFESYELNREKIILGGRKAIVFIGPLAPGEYPFFGEFNPQTALGTILVVAESDAP